MKTIIAIVKGVTIVAFMVTLSTTYYLRSEVLELNRIRFSSDNLRAEEKLQEMKRSYPTRMKEYEVRVKNYELQREHFQEMLELYESDYDAYVKRLKDNYRPPQLPQRPSKPRSPELSDQLAKINAEFRAQQFHYFNTTSRLNWVCGAAALLLTGGLLFLVMFESGGARLFYVIVLVVSFVFMIGPSFHSIMSAIVGFLQAPPVM